MENVVLKVGDRVKINPIYRTELVQGLTKGKTGTIQKIHYYPNVVYEVKYDEPYTCCGYIVDYENYHEKELEKIMKKFELFLGCLGNGTTVCNKAVEENGDYKTIAHISEGGNIRWYVKESYVPADAMKTIQEVAARDKAEFQKRFESLSDIEQYGEIVEGVSYDKFMEILDDKRPLVEKLPDLRKYYYSIM